jgi:hypothetical protein
MRQALMSKGKDLRGVCLIMSRRQQLCPRLTNEAPARVFHQGPQPRLATSSAASMTGCSLSVRTLARRLDAMRMSAVMQ